MKKIKRNFNLVLIFIGFVMLISSIILPLIFLKMFMDLCTLEFIIKLIPTLIFTLIIAIIGAWILDRGFAYYEQGKIPYKLGDVFINRETKEILVVTDKDWYDSMILEDKRGIKLRYSYKEIEEVLIKIG